MARHVHVVPRARTRRHPHLAERRVTRAVELVAGALAGVAGQALHSSLPPLPARAGARRRPAAAAGTT